MRENPTTLAEPTIERINRLLRELKQAIQHDRHALLLAVYRSEFVRADVEAHLAMQLHEIDQKIERVFINEKLEDLPLHLRNRADKSRTVFFVSGLRFGGGSEGRNAYRALNIRREYFLEDRLRVVFWLTESEAEVLPYFAPDFWAFRHRVVEFMEYPTKEQIKQHSRELTFRDFDTTSPKKLLKAFSEDTDAKIAYREQMLADIPDNQANWKIRADILFSLAVFYALNSKGDDQQRGLNILNELIEVSKNAEDLSTTISALKVRGVMYKSRDQFEMAIDDYTQAIGLDPQDVSAHIARGDIYMDLLDFDRAIDDFTKAIILDPNNEEAFFKRGNANVRLGFFDRALTDFSEAIILNPELFFPYASRGATYFLMAEYERAITDYTNAIDLNPKLSILYRGRGDSYFEIRDLKKAIIDFDQAIALDPDNPSNHISRGKSFNKLGHFELAIDDFNEAILLDPNNATYYEIRGNLYFELDEIEKAISDFHSSLEIEPNDTEILYSLALALRVNKDYENAIKACLKILNIRQGDWSVYNGLGYLYIQIQNYDLANKYLLEALRLQKHPLTLLNLGIVNWHKNHKETAIKNFKESLNLISKSVDKSDLLTVKGWLMVAIGEKKMGLKIIQDESDFYNSPNDSANLRDWSNAMLLSENPPEGMDEIIQILEKTSIQHSS